MDEVNEISSFITIKNPLSNRLQGSFRLFVSDLSDQESAITVKQSDGSMLRSAISVRQSNVGDIKSSIDIVYANTSDLEAMVLAVVHSDAEASINVRPHNRLAGMFNLMPPPVKTKVIYPIADATTRSQAELRIINYGDTRSMITGSTAEETFKAFIQFNDLRAAIPDLKILKCVKLRIYYSSFIDGASLELQQPNTIWRELGITDVNKPYPIETLCDTYANNTKNRYVEFDLFDVAQRWLSHEIENYGFIISTPDDHRYTFLTRESDNPPQLIVEYITTQIYSPGRSELESSLFVYGKDYKDVAASLTVFSSVGLDYKEAHLYVHRQADFMEAEHRACITVSAPDVGASLITMIPDSNDVSGTVTIMQLSADDHQGIIQVNRPDTPSRITVDPNMSLESSLIVAIAENDDRRSYMNISVPDLGACLTVSNYTSGKNDLDSSLMIRAEFNDDRSAFIAVNRPDMYGKLMIRALGESNIPATIQVPAYDDLSSVIGASRPEINGELTVKYTSHIEGQIIVKDKQYLDAFIDVRNISDLTGSISIKKFNDLESSITPSNPDLFAYISPRVPGLADLDSAMQIKKRFAGDLDGFLIVKGKGNRNFIIIF